MLPVAASASGIVGVVIPPSSTRFGKGCERCLRPQPRYPQRSLVRLICVLEAVAAVGLDVGIYLVDGSIKGIDDIGPVGDVGHRLLETESGR